MSNTTLEENALLKPRIKLLIAQVNDLRDVPLNQEDIARMLKFTPQYFSGIVNGQPILKMNKAHDLVQIFRELGLKDCTVNDLYELREDGTK